MSFCPVVGVGGSAIGALVERGSLSTLLAHLPRLEGWGEKPHVKNGPSLGGYGAVAMKAALTASMTKLPEQLRKTLTWEHGKELSRHALVALETRNQSVLYRPALAVAAADQQERQRSATPALPQRCRPGPLRT